MKTLKSSSLKHEVNLYIKPPNELSIGTLVIFIGYDQMTNEH